MKNILVLSTDQQRYDTIEALGNPIIKTPTLNKLVENGVAYNRAFSPSPVCIPARFAMTTGIDPCVSDHVLNEYMPKGYNSIMEILVKNGYQTQGVGKMHFHYKGEDFNYPWAFREGTQLMARILITVNLLEKRVLEILNM